MKSIGIDLVEVHRFAHFHTKPNQQLCCLFSPDEIAYCCQTPCTSAERFAARFAAKEAAYKALAALHKLPPLRTFAHNCAVKRRPAPQFVINWQQLALPEETLHLSLTHTARFAQAVVIIDN